MRGFRHARLAVLFTALSASLLPACVGAEKSAERQAADRRTAQAVREALQADPLLYAEHVTVWVDDGVVHLGGRVWNDWSMYEAQQVARAVPGVRETVNEMDLPREDINNSYGGD